MRTCLSETYIYELIQSAGNTDLELSVCNCRRASVRRAVKRRRENA